MIFPQLQQNNPLLKVFMMAMLNKKKGKTISKILKIESKTFNLVMRPTKKQRLS